MYHRCRNGHPHSDTHPSGSLRLVQSGRSDVRILWRHRRWLCRSSAAALLLGLVACADEATGPGFLYVFPVGAVADTAWQGAPGEPIPSGVAVGIKDAEGRPVAGASVTWETEGRNAQVLAAASQSDARGLATAVWQLGTDASEQEQLHVTVRWGRRNGSLTLRARAVPHVVAQLRVSVDSHAVLRVGDSLPIVVTALDPYGNTFPAPPARLSVSDTTMGTVSGSFVIGGPKRGTTEVTVTSDYVTTRVSLQTVQRVAAIIPGAATLSFRSLGAVVPITYQVRDDRGLVVADTAATLAVVDTAVALLQLASGGCANQSSPR